MCQQLLNVVVDVVVAVVVDWPRSRKCWRLGAAPKSSKRRIATWCTHWRSRNKNWIFALKKRSLSSFDPCSFDPGSYSKTSWREFDRFHVLKGFIWRIFVNPTWLLANFQGFRLDPAQILNIWGFTFSIFDFWKRCRKTVTRRWTVWKRSLSAKRWRIWSPSRRWPTWRHTSTTSPNSCTSSSRKRWNWNKSSTIQVAPLIETTRNRLQFKRFNADVGTSIPDDAKADMKNFQFSPPPSLSSFVNGKASFSDSKLPPPPPPPPLNGPPPPPPPGGLRLDKPVLVKKDVPPSSVPLKCFNWTKIPDAKVAGTIWNELDEAKLYKVIDLSEFDQLFSAYQKNGLNHVSVPSFTLPSSLTVPKKKYDLVIDVILIDVLTAWWIQRRSACPVDGEVQNPRLVGGWWSTRSKLHHSPLQVEDDQRRYHSVTNSC